MRHPETAQLIASDIHFGRATDSYDQSVCRQRLEDLAEKLGTLRELKSGYDFDGLVINLLGDICDGSDIYRGQANYQANTNVRDQAHEVAKLLAHFVRSQVPIWKQVRIEAVAGNHGRSGWQTHDMANWDLVAYDYLAAELPGYQFRYEVGCMDCFLRISEVRGHRYLLYHGHEILGYAGIPYYGIDRRVKNWYATLAVGPVEAAFLGHFHTCANFPIGAADAYLTGTMVSHDPWALRRFGTEARNEWWLIGTSDKRPVTFQYRLQLSEG